MALQKVLLIDDDEKRGSQIESVMSFLDYNTKKISLDKLKKTAKQDELPLVMLGDGTVFNEMDIVDFFTQYKSQQPIIYVHNKGKAPKLGTAIARHFVSLEWPTTYQNFINCIRKVQLTEHTLTEEVSQRAAELFRSLVGNSQEVKRVRQLIQQVCMSDATVLILGESGTGKEVIARNIHYHSSRRQKAFVPINCGAIPGELLESELFGHEKGAFTGALTARQGRFELAEGGTLFLDEIGDMPMQMQVKLLRVLQEKVFERVGSNKPIRCDVRILAATHRDLEHEIAEGGFREDLYYRLDVFPITIGPLRDRVEDIPMLVNELVQRIERDKKGTVRFTSAALMALCQYSWPGNVRELANMVERLAIIYAYGVVDVKDLPDKFHQFATSSTHVQEELALEAAPLEDATSRAAQSVTPQQNNMSAGILPQQGIDLKEHLNNLEYSLIQQALDESNGVVAHAAKKLNMRRTTLVEKMRKHGM
ncbi:MAG: sigma-54-dependent Fis family transcriptional regulator [Cycloclasticus sp.]|nr:sigma-54-dependent Fis family transcriptional regulator [Cycloclasticus sp.]MBQ0789665.1 sigma-54-dependent Fis family transcriptional regulator [Cycloclasticus sp.]